MAASPRPCGKQSVALPARTMRRGFSGLACGLENMDWPKAPAKPDATFRAIRKETPKTEMIMQVRRTVGPRRFVGT